MLDVINMDDEEIEASVETSTRGYNVATGEKLNKSSARYEVVRMLLDNMSYAEISNNLKHIFRIDCSVDTIVAFKKIYLPVYKDMVSRWDMSRHQYIVARVTEEMKAASKKMVQEVHEIERLMSVVDDRMKKLRNDPDRQSAAYEGVLQSYIKTKAALAQRMSEITGTTGVEEQLKAMVHRTAMAAQKTLHPYVSPDKRDEVFKLYDQELEEILISIESGAALVA